MKIIKVDNSRRLRVYLQSPEGGGLVQGWGSDVKVDGIGWVEDDDGISWEKAMEKIKHVFGNNA